jgi:hypothetical protein
MNQVLDELAKIVGRAWARAWLEKMHNKETSDKREAEIVKSRGATQSGSLIPSSEPNDREDSNDAR